MLSFCGQKGDIDMDEAEYRRLLKKNHICRDCRKQDAYTLAGRTYCFECAEKGRKAKAQARKDPEKRAKMLLQKRQQIGRYITENKCVRCGKQLRDRKRMCGVCYELQRRAQRKSRGATPRGLGLCWQCNKKPCIDGKKLCEVCYEWKLPIALANLEKSRKDNHPWKKSLKLKATNA